jgi:hypothetical protein
MLSLYLGDSQVFYIECFDADGSTEVTPVSGYFRLVRVNDDTTVVNDDSAILISGHDVYYNYRAVDNTVAGFMKYSFTMYFSGSTVQTFGGYAEIISRRI